MHSTPPSLCWGVWCASIFSSHPTPGHPQSFALGFRFFFLKFIRSLFARGSPRFTLSLRGASQNSPGTARNCQVLLGVTRSRQEAPGRFTILLRGASQNSPGTASSCQEAARCGQEQARSNQELPGAASSCFGQPTRKSKVKHRI